MFHASLQSLTPGQMGECWHQRCYLPGIPTAPPCTCSPLQPPASLGTHVSNRELWGLLRLRGRCEWRSTDLQEPSAKPPLSPPPLSANSHTLFSFNLFLAALGLHCCVQAFSSCSEWGLLSVVSRLLIVAASLVAEHGL